jgi:hypothetical protein
MHDDVERDWAWADKFLPHQMEIAREVLRVDVAPVEDDLRRNTDLILRSAVPMRRGELRISARVRRHEYLGKLAGVPGLAYRNQITIRDRRPSGARTEMDKVRLGEGDIFVYGFESAPGSDRLSPWVVVNLDLIRAYDIQGGYSTVRRNKGDRASWLRVFCLDDLLLGTVLKSEGIETTSQGERLSCRNPNWDDPAKPMRSGWCNRGYAVVIDDFLRQCTFCGFKWRAATPELSTI